MGDNRWIWKATRWVDTYLALKPLPRGPPRVGVVGCDDLGECPDATLADATLAGGMCEGGRSTCVGGGACAPADVAQGRRPRRC